MFGHRGVVRLILICGLLGACAAPGGPTAIVITTEGQTGAEAASADTTMMAGPFRYELAQELPELDGAAPAYQAQGDAATESDVHRVAAALGLDDDVVPAEWGSGWTVGPTDGSGASLTVNGGPLGEWWFGANAVTAMVCVEPGVEGVPDGAVAPDRACAAEPVPAQNLPTDAAAREQAQQLMDSIGGWVGDDVRVSRDVYGVTVEFRTALGGVATPFWGNVRYGADAVLESASGYLGTFEEAGDYPRIGTTAAFELLQSGATAPWLAAYDLAVAAETGSDDSTGAGGGSSADPGAPDADRATAEPVEDPQTPEPAADAPVSSEPGSDTPAPDDPSSSEPGTGTPAPDDPGSSEPGSDTPAPDDPGSSEPGTGTPAPDDPGSDTPAPLEPDPVVVTITGVSEGLWTLYAADDSVWLVPAYHFIAADGAEYPVVAIPADLIEVAEPSPAPVEPRIEPAEESAR